MGNKILNTINLKATLEDIFKILDVDVFEKNIAFANGFHLSDEYTFHKKQVIKNFDHDEQEFLYHLEYQYDELLNNSFFLVKMDFTSKKDSKFVHLKNINVTNFDFSFRYENEISNCT